jgi:hypothetical protein
MSTALPRTKWVLLLATVLLLAVPVRSAGQDARFLHALIVADTNDALIGPDVNLDGRNVYTRLMREVPWQRLGITRLIGERKDQMIKGQEN